MSARTRSLMMRLKAGGVLVVAPANIFPWPSMLDPASRHLHIQALRLALPDPDAMRRLRTEYGPLVGTPIARHSTLTSDRALIDAYIQAAKSGMLTVIQGYAESTNADRPPGTPMQEMFGSHPVVSQTARAVGQVTSSLPDKLPPSGTPVPRSLEGRMAWVVARAPSHMTEDDVGRLREFFGPTGRATTTAILVLWAGSHGTGVGFVVDASLFVTTMWQAGLEALLTFEQLKEFFEKVQLPDGWTDLDAAADLLASVASTFGVAVMRQMMRQVGSRTGVGGRGGGGGSSASSRASVSPDDSDDD